MSVINSQVPSTTVFEGFDRKILSHSPELMTCEIRLKSGTKVAAHTHHHQQVTYLISGRLTATVGGETREIGPGDSLFVDKNIEHAIVALADTLALDIFTPRRDDFL
jgi:quercetin dioxygenase-like cupin family protein